MFTREEWTMALLADRAERDRLVGEVRRREAKLALPLTPARKRVNPQHWAALINLRAELESVEARLAVRKRVLRAAGVEESEDIDDGTASATVAFFRWQMERA